VTCWNSLGFCCCSCCSVVIICAKGESWWLSAGMVSEDALALAVLLLELVEPVEFVPLAAPDRIDCKYASEFERALTFIPDLSALLPPDARAPGSAAFHVVPDAA